jgi:histidine triad (HIT) family protein
MTYDPNNLFAKILHQEIPSISVYEDKSNLAFMDVMPQADGHVLVVPKENAETIFDLSDESAAKLIVVTKMLTRAVKTAMNADGITLMQFNGAAAGQSVPHIHFHVIPRWNGISLRRHSGNMEDPEKLKTIADKIRAVLSLDDK